VFERDSSGRLDAVVAMALACWRRGTPRARSRSGRTASRTTAAMKSGSLSPLGAAPQWGYVVVVAPWHPHSPGRRRPNAPSAPHSCGGPSGSWSPTRASPV